MTTDELYSIYKDHSHITTDSRRCLPGSLFFALRGDSFDGNQFAVSAIEQGCSYAFVDREGLADGKRIFWVNNGLEALQQLAAHHRRVWGRPLIAITGTNGKTTTKELIAAVLRCRYNVLATEGNLNNHIGVPLMLLRLTEQHQLAVIEMGASKPGDIRELAEIAQPTEGIITNIGKAHLQGFGSIEGVRKTKGELYDYLRLTGGHLYVNADDPLLCEMSKEFERSFYGTDPSVSVCGSVDPGEHTLLFDLTVGRWSRKVSTRLVGGYNLPNALAAVAVGIRRGVEPNDAAVALEAYSPQNMRSQFRQTLRNKLVVDTYNANPSSVEAALRNFARWNDSRTMVILGDMKELGVESEAEHRKVIGLLNQLSLSRVVLCGNEYAKCSPPEMECFETTEELCTFIRENPIEGYTVLVKGSRSMRLEQVVELL